VEEVTLTCKAESCKSQVNSRGFCVYHYTQFHRGWRDEDGNRTPSYRGRDDAPVACIIQLPKKCINRPEKRGFCPKHYRWFRKGNADETGKVTPKYEVAPRYKDTDTCAVKECKNKPRRKGFCPSHSSGFYSGKYQANGEIADSWKKERKSYGKDWKCIFCKSEKGPFVLSFCKPCYNGKFLKGYIDPNGRPLGRGPKRIGSYKETDICRARGCEEQARSRFFCYPHFSRFQSGFLDADGLPTDKLDKFKNKGLVCRKPGCKTGAITLGFCSLHYSRFKSTGVAYDNRAENPNLKNKGKTCALAGCKAPAVSRGHCNKHYSRIKNKQPVKDEDFYVNKGKKCDTENCQKAAKIKGFCYKHWRRLLKDQPMQDKDFYINKKKFCKIDECWQWSKVEGLCSKHYDRKRLGRPIDDKEHEKYLKETFHYNVGKACDVEGCTNDMHYNGKCRYHNMRKARNMAPTPVLGTCNAIDGCEAKAVSEKLGLCLKHHLEYARFISIQRELEDYRRLLNARNEVANESSGVEQQCD